MFDGAFQPLHWLLVIGIIMILFGPKKLPELGKGLGESIRGFREALSGSEHPTTPAANPAAKSEPEPTDHPS
jgi:sec-independent protein translocase protein TatA